MDIVIVSMDRQTPSLRLGCTRISCQRHILIKWAICQMTCSVISTSHLMNRHFIQISRLAGRSLRHNKWRIWLDLSSISISFIKLLSSIFNDSILIHIFIPLSFIPPFSPLQVLPTTPSTTHACGEYQIARKRRPPLHSPPNSAGTGFISYSIGRMSGTLINNSHFPFHSSPNPLPFWLPISGLVEVQHSAHQSRYTSTLPYHPG